MSSGSNSELWRYRELLYFFAWRDIKVRYKQAALGIAWAIVQPLFTMITFTFFFNRLAGIPSDGVPYPLFSYSALLLWTYASFTLGHAGNSLVNNSGLITKVYFPRVLLPAASALGGILDILIGSSLLIVLMLYYHVAPSWTILLAPIYVLQMILLILGMSMILSAMNVRYRDIKYAIPFLVQIWLFVTPIIYPVSFLPERLRGLAALNPMTGIVEGFRACLFPGSRVDWQLVATSWIVTILFLLIGGWYFRKTERVFADIV